MQIVTATTQQVLRECKVFSGLSEADIEKVASSALLKQFEPGSVIFEEGSSAEEILVVEEGKVALQMTLPTGETGRRITVDLISANEVIGWSALVEPYVFTLTAVCLHNVKALSISANKLRWLMRDNPKLGYEIMKGIIQVAASRLDETRHVLVSERSLPLWGAPKKLN